METIIFMMPKNPISVADERNVGQVGNLPPIGNRLYKFFAQDRADYQSAAGYQPAPHYVRRRLIFLSTCESLEYQAPVRAAKAERIRECVFDVHRPGVIGTAIPAARRFGTFV